MLSFLKKKTFKGSINGIIITLISPRGRPPTHFENNNGDRAKKRYKNLKFFKRRSRFSKAKPFSDAEKKQLLSTWDFILEKVHKYLFVP